MCQIITGLGLHFQAAADTIIYLWQHVPETTSTVKFQGIYLCVISLFIQNRDISSLNRDISNFNRDISIKIRDISIYSEIEISLNRFMLKRLPINLRLSDQKSKVLHDVFRIKKSGNVLAPDPCWKWIICPDMFYQPPPPQD